MPAQSATPTLAPLDLLALHRRPRRSQGPRHRMAQRLALNGPDHGTLTIALSGRRNSTTSVPGSTWPSISQALRSTLTSSSAVR